LSRFLYSMLTTLALPFMVLYLLWRARQQPEYLAHWGERFGWAYSNTGHEKYNDDLSSTGCIWIHAVSLGETLAAESLIQSLRVRFPSRAILLTHTTPTGRDAGHKMALRIANLKVVYLPYDTSWGVRRFLGHFKPSLGLLMETEVWPNLVANAHQSALPLALINARLSERSLQRGLKYPVLARAALSNLSLVLAQNTEDARRLRQLGALNVQVTGNLKFDITPREEVLGLGRRWRQRWGREKVLLMANTREGEEAALLSAFKAQFSRDETDWLLILVPRHPQRFDEVEKLIRAQGLSMIRRSNHVAFDPSFALDDASVDSIELAKCQVVLGDSLGEMPAYYAAADVCIMGGSFEKLGGHNLIEACASGCPVVLGPHMFNFAQASQQAVEAGAAWQESTPQAALTKAHALLGVERRDLDQARLACQGFSRQHQGATERTLALLAPILPRAVAVLP
jgi:3-deoxy-D-manno-octulosonic-acid transferase